MEDLSDVYDKRTAEISAVNKVHDDKIAAIAKEHAVADIFNESAKNNLINEIYSAEEYGGNVADIVADA